MKAHLLKSFHFRHRDELPYCKDGRGGFVFHGVGSHILWNDIQNRWYRFAFEVATEDQPQEAVLQKTRLLLSVEDATTVPEQSIIEWEPSSKRETSNPRYCSYQWTQHLQIDIRYPTMASIAIEMQFSGFEDWLRVDGSTRVLVDMHPHGPPRYYNSISWYLRRLLRG